MVSPFFHKHDAICESYVFKIVSPRNKARLNFQFYYECLAVKVKHIH